MAKLKPLPRVRLIHWKPEEASERVETLRRAGYHVDYTPRPDSSILRPIRLNPPDAILIDLTRLPARGREVGMVLRGTSTTHSIPLVFVEGEPAKVATIRQHLPDATYGTWKTIRSAIRKALAAPREGLKKPAPYMARFAGRPLARKLGVKPGMKVGLFDAPGHFDRTIASLPENIDWREDRFAGTDLILCFARSLDRLEAGLNRSARAGVPLWIFWPKRSAGVSTDVTQQDVMAAAAEFGLVDYKICSFDATWSGRLYTARRKKQA